MFNTVVFQGNMVRDGEFADTKETDILNFTIASSRKYKEKEDVTFVDCTAYGNTAINIGKFFSKGSPIGVIGRLSQNCWEDRDGNKRSKIFITVDGFHFVGNTDKENGGGRDNDRGGRRNSRGGGRSRERNRGGSRDNGRDDNRGQRDGNDGRNSRSYDDDIPF